MPNIKIERPNPMLGVCRQSRAAALNPAKGRYASLSMQYYLDESGSADVHDDRECGHRIIYIRTAMFLCSQHSAANRGQASPSSTSP